MQYKNFGQFIHNKRLSLVPAVSLNKFALNNELEPTTLSRIENSKQDLSLTVLNKLANGFNLNVSELIKEYEQSPYSHSNNYSK